MREELPEILRRLNRGGLFVGGEPKNGSELFYLTKGIAGFGYIQVGVAPSGSSDSGKFYIFHGEEDTELANKLGYHRRCYDGLWRKFARKTENDADGARIHAHRRLFRMVPGITIDDPEKPIELEYMSSSRREMDDFFHRMRHDEGVNYVTQGERAIQIARETKSCYEIARLRYLGSKVYSVYETLTRFLENGIRIDGQGTVKVKESGEVLKMRDIFNIIKENSGDRYDLKTANSIHIGVGKGSTIIHPKMTYKEMECRINLGDPIRIDFFPRTNMELNAGYFIDSATTFTIGEASEEVMDGMNVSKEAMADALESLKVGTKYETIDTKIRRRLGIMGYGDSGKGKSILPYYFGMGHGVGLDIHEIPHISLHTKEVAKTGHVLAIEPCFMKEDFCIQWEDTFLIGRNGPEALVGTPAPRVIYPR